MLSSVPRSSLLKFGPKQAPRLQNCARFTNFARKKPIVSSEAGLNRCTIRLCSSSRPKPAARPSSPNLPLPRAEARGTCWGRRSHHGFPHLVNHTHEQFWGIFSAVHIRGICSERGLCAVNKERQNTISSALLSHNECDLNSPLFRGVTCYHQALATHQSSNVCRLAPGRTAKIRYDLPWLRIQNVCDTTMDGKF
mmetsp:Transcript_114/g.476  ORF Transcript_114/g.476 Transcript_114/m.476 type:complete len:195 (-) Transcript_114:663-1247(-)